MGNLKGDRRFNCPGLAAAMWLESLSPDVCGQEPIQTHLGLFLGWRPPRVYVV